jgi:RNA polymerase sigma-70 factor (ECF subfamily)
MPRAAETPTDQILINQVQMGSRTAYETLLKRHERLVAKSVHDVVRDLTAVEELMQDVFIKVFQKLHLYDPEKGRFPVWLGTVARHEAINYIRRHKRAGTISLEATGGNVGFSPIDRPSEQASKKEVWGQIIDAIGKLKEPAQTILKMRMIEGKRFDQIAKSLDRPLDTVKTIYYRNTESLRKKLGVPL